MRNVRDHADVVLYLVNAAEDPRDAGYLEPMPMTAAEFAEQVKADAAKWERIVRESGVKQD